MPDKPVMIIEDDPDIRELVNEFLQMEGYEVEAFDNAPAALTQLGHGLRPMVILVDWRMPIMSGKEFMEKYVEIFINDADRSPVYIFSAEYDQKLAGEIGFAGILKKPVEFDKLLDLLASRR